MHASRKALSTAATVSLVLVTIGAAVLGGYLSLGLGAGTASNVSINVVTFPITTFAASSTSYYASSTEATNNASGLQLELYTSSSAFYPGQKISVNITEYNTLSKINVVSAARNWPIQGLSLGPCGGNLPVGIEVFYGYFSPTNISSGLSNETVQFYKPGVYYCPAMFNISSYAFQPRSANASWYPVCTGNDLNSAGCSVPASATISFNGSWTRGGALGQGSFLKNLSPGTYTIVGGDEWGGVVMLHFEIIGQTTVTQSTAIPPPAVVYPGGAPQGAY